MERQAWFPKIRVVLLVLVWTGILMWFSGGKSWWKSWYKARIIHANESVLKNDLQDMREAIHRYTVDRRQPPESLQALVDENYLRMIPTDPITHEVDWVPHYVNFDLRGGKLLVGIDDVHAGTRRTDRNGVPYSDW